MTRQFEDYPPEFDLSAQELQRYGITKIWAAFHNPNLRRAVFSEWRSANRSFPAWVDQKVYAQRRAKHSPSRAGGGSTHRAHWRKQYAAELAESPALAVALSDDRQGLGEVFRLAGLSNQETAVMRRLFDGGEPAEIREELGLSKGNYWNIAQRAVFKIKTAFVVPPRLVREGTISEIA